MATQPMTETWPALVVLPAEIDVTNADGVHGQVVAALRPGVRIVIADMGAAGYCDSMGVRMLVLAHEQGARDGTELRLLRPGYAVPLILELTGTGQVLTICQSLADAIMP
jgi:anti-sigma B factor antagonist